MKRLCWRAWLVPVACAVAMGLVGFVAGMNWEANLWREPGVERRLNERNEEFCERIGGVPYSLPSVAELRSDVSLPLQGAREVHWLTAGNPVERAEHVTRYFGEHEELFSREFRFAFREYVHSCIKCEKISSGRAPLNFPEAQRALEVRKQEAAVERAFSNLMEFSRGRDAISW